MVLTCLSGRSWDALAGSMTRNLEESLVSGDMGRHSVEVIPFSSARCRLIKRRLRIVVVIAHTKLLHSTFSMLHVG